MPPGGGAGGAGEAAVAGRVQASAGLLATLFTTFEEKLRQTSSVRQVVRPG